MIAGTLVLLLQEILLGFSFKERRVQDFVLDFVSNPSNIRINRYSLLLELSILLFLAFT